MCRIQSANNFRKMSTSIKAITVFCGASSGDNPRYEETAKLLGKCLVDQKIDLIYGGGDTGLMGALASTVHGNGGSVTGFLPEFITQRFPVRVRDYNGKTVMVTDMHTRKRTMLEQCDAFIALPGGFGTSEELLEMITWRQLGLHDKPVGILNIAGYYDKFLEWVLHAVKSGFIANDSGLHYPREMCVADNPQELIEKLKASVAEQNKES